MLNFKSLILFVVYFLGINGLIEDSSNDPLVHINDGYLRGEMMTSEKGESFLAFRGIPYAEPPIGKLRFKRPIPNQSWKGVRNATEDGPPCPQFNFSELKYVGSEDCLYLNVYTPKPSQNNDTKYDVLFYIHGGGFTLGSGGSSSFGPRRFPLQDAILVSVTYRVSAMGFLSTNDAASPGNYGLLDQLQGLRWVKNNIDYFGGDPNRVTLIGQSAGSVSVIYHMFSPLSEGLFQKAIALSGSPLIPYALQKDPLYWTRQLAQTLECSVENSETLLECLRNKSAEDITLQSIELIGLNLLYTFSPTIDNYFITENPLDTLKNGSFQKNIPIMMGTTKGEAYCWSSYKKQTANITDDEILSTLKVIVDVRPNINETLEKIKDKYFSHVASRENDVIQEIIRKAITDGKYHIPIYYTTKLMVDYGMKVYFYQYDYFGPWFRKPGHGGVCHGDDLYLLFDGKFHVDSFDAESEKMKENYQDLITNFVQAGSPTANTSASEDWPPCDPENFYIYHINDTFSVEHYYYINDDIYQFWIQILDELNISPINNWKIEL